MGAGYSFAWNGDAYSFLGVLSILHPLSALPMWDGGEADICENTYFFSSHSWQN